MNRRPGLSARLKLTLSYAGFLMLAGTLLLAAVWVFLLRGVPDGAFVPNLSDLLRAFDPRNFGPRVFGPAAAAVLAFLLVFGLLGGWILAGRMLAPLTRIADAARMAANGSLSHRIRMEGPKDEFRELADVFDTMLEQLESHVTEQQRFAANASHELRTPRPHTPPHRRSPRHDSTSRHAAGIVGRGPRPDVRAGREITFVIWQHCLREHTATRQTRWSAGLGTGHPLARHIGDFLADLRNQNSPAHTRRAYRGDPLQFAAHHGEEISELTARPVRAYLAEITGLAPSTRKRKRAAVTSFCKWAVRHDLLAANPMDRIDTIKVPKTLPRPAAAADVAKVLNTICSRRPRKDEQVDRLRDRVLRLDDEHVRIHGKGGTVRTVLLDDRGHVALIKLYLARTGYQAPRSGPRHQPPCRASPGPRPSPRCCERLAWVVMLWVEGQAGAARVGAGGADRVLDAGRRRLAAGEQQGRRDQIGLQPDPQVLRA